MSLSTKVTGQQVWEALKVLDYATVSMCEALIEKHGTQRAAANSVGVTNVHFCNMMARRAKASLDLLERMCVEVDE